MVPLQVHGSQERVLSFMVHTVSQDVAIPLPTAYMEP